VSATLDGGHHRIGTDETEEVRAGVHVAVMGGKYPEFNPDITIEHVGSRERLFLGHFDVKFKSYGFDGDTYAVSSKSVAVSALRGSE